MNRGVLETVNERTQLAGENRLELLLFYLENKQTYGLNVFKIREIIRTPTLTNVPKSHPIVKGIMSIRGTTIPVIDLSLAMGFEGVKNYKDCFIIITEFNQTSQGFLVSKVERIINTNWENITPPPPGLKSESFLTAVTKDNGNLVEIIDVEKILAEISPKQKEVDKTYAQLAEEKGIKGRKILICDDSAVARKQITQTLEGLGLEVIAKNNGKEALDFLIDLKENGKKINEELLLMISDVEMPTMDGYKLTSEIRKTPEFEGFHVILHTSLSGVFNSSLVHKVGANQFVPKFKPDMIIKSVLNYDTIKSVDEVIKSN